MKTTETNDLPDSRPGKTQGSSVWQVNGRVLNLSGTPLKGLWIKAFHQDPVKEKILLGETRTEQDGSYHLDYEVTPLKENGKDSPSPNLTVQVMDQTKRRVLASSPVLFAVHTPETVNLMIETREDQLSEVEQYQHHLESLLRDEELSSLAEEHLTHLARESGIPRKVLGFLATAHQYGKDTGLPPAVFYAFIMQGLPAGLTALLMQDPARWNEALIAALGANQIPKALKKEKEKIIGRLLEYRTGHLHQSAERDGFSLVEILETTGAEPEVLGKFMDLYFQRQGAEPEFWNTLEKDPAFRDKKVLEDFKFTWFASLATQGNAVLIKQLHTRRKNGEVTAARELVRWTANDWETLIGKIKRDGKPVLPESIMGKTEREKIRNYAAEIQRLFIELFPMETVRLGIEQGEDGEGSLHADVLRVFHNMPDLDFRESTVTALVEREGSRMLAGVENSEDTLLELQRLYRVFQVVPRYDHMKVFLDARLDSAFAFSSVPKTNFLRDFAEKLGGEETALRYYQKAQSTNAAAMHLAAAYQQLLTDATPEAVDSPSGVEAVKNELKKLPNLEGLFGSLDLCECSHCRSVYGPAAYFVDLLQFLRKSSGTPYQALMQRRPDLEHIKLTCENSNTPLPYVDLVNEVLEFYVDHGEITQQLAKDTENITAEELRVHPQYTNENAYLKLKQAVHGFLLPFDRPLEWVRTYLEHLQSSRYELMTVFRKDSQPSDLELAAESLGFSAEETQILLGQNPEPAAAFYGYTDPNDLEPLLLQNNKGPFVVILQKKLNNAGANPPLAEDGIFGPLTFNAVKAFQSSQGLAVDGKVGPQTWGALQPFEPDTLGALIGHVPNFLARTGLAYTDVVELLKTRHANPDQTSQPLPPDTVVLYSPDSVCELQKTWIQHLDGTVLNETEWMNIHRFLRLWKKTGWSIQEVDKTLASLSAQVIDEALIRDIAHIQFLRERFGKPVVHFLSLWAPLDTFGPTQTTFPAGAAISEPSLFEKLFQNKAVLNPVDGAFTLSTPPAAPEIVGDGQSPMLLSAHVPALLAGLQINATDLVLLREAASVQDENAPLTLENVTRLYRHAFLAKALRMPVRDYVALLVLFGIDASQPFSPVEARELAERALRVKNSAFSVPELNYLYRHWTEPFQSIAPLNETVLLQLDKLRAELQKIMDETRPLPDPSGEILRQKLELLLDAALVAPAMEIIEAKSQWGSAEQEQFINDHFQGFLDVNDAKTALLGPSGLSPEERADVNRMYVLVPLCAYLRHTLSRALVKQTIAEALQLEGEMVSFLLEEHLSSQLQGNQPLEADFLALAGDGLKAEYFSNAQLSGNPVLTRTDPEVNFDWSQNPPDPQLPQSGFSVRWTGQWSAPQEEVYTFYLRVPGGVRFWFDNQLVIDQWQESAQAVEYTWTTPAPPEAGQFYPLKIEFTRSNPGALIEWLWSSLSVPKSAVFQSHLYSGDTTELIHKLLHSYLFLHKTSLLANGFHMTPGELNHFSSHGADFENFNLNDLPLDHSNPATVDTQAPALFLQWEALAAFFMLRENLSQKDITLLDVVASASDQEARERLANLAGWRLEDVIFLSGPTGLQLAAADFRNASAPGRLKEAFDLGRRLGIPVQELAGWAVTSPDAQLARNLVHAVRARYTEEQWQDAAKPLNDGLREKQKQALIAYVLAEKKIAQQGIQDSNQLFEYFLIDVNMDPCFMTSRLKQALASVQLFVQRCLLNLETGVSPDLIDEDRWNWMKYYRVWEANRKVFLYPENWIEPELRDDKSPLFKALEGELLQNEPTEENAERAFLKYLERLDDIAHLEIAGVCRDPENTKITRVFSRTFNAPHLYYQRYFNSETEGWSPWERIELDIEGEHILPVVWNRRLYLFWPIFKEKTHPGSQQQANGYPLPEGAPPVLDWEIGLAWSEYRENKWLPRKTSTQVVKSWHFWDDTSVGHFLHLPEPRYHYFQTGISSDDELVIQCFRKYDPHRSGYVITDDNKYYWTDSWQVIVRGHEKVGEFQFTGCNGKVLTNSYAGTLSLDERLGPVKSRNEFMGFQTYFSYNDDKHFSFQDKQQTKVLDETMQRFRFLASPQTPEPATLYYPFLFQDDKRTYFVTPVKEYLLDFGVLQRIPQLSAQQARYRESFAMATEAPSSVRRQEPKYDLSVLFNDRSENSRNFLLAGETLASRHFVNPNLVLGRAETSWQTYSSSSNYGFEAQPTGTFPGHLSETVVEAAYVTHLKFHTLFHPHVCALIKSLNKKGMPGLISLSNQKLSHDPSGQNLFDITYDPSAIVNKDYPREDIDFDGGAYSLYNWEIFFHVPMLMADRLSKNQRFEEALKWYHFVFFPMESSSKPAPEKYWQFLPFSENKESGRLLDLLMALNSGKYAEKKKLMQQVEVWRSNPFNPHLIARMRMMAYQKNVVLKYIENLIAWADKYFTMDTMESINEAIHLYITAANLLGKRPERIPPRGKIETKTYAELRPELDSFSNALVEMENLFPFSSENGSNANSTPGSDGLGIATAFYFCIPQNEKLLGLWDTVEDRLFKIRHCMNIEGIVRELPLYQPPIDPALLVKATAMGLDIGSVLSDISAPTPPYRFQFLVQKSMDLCSQVKAFGAELLATLEKRDAEELSLMRTRHENDLLKTVKEVRKQQIQEARESLLAIGNSRKLAEQRQTFYRNLITRRRNAKENLQLRKLEEANDRQEESTFIEVASQAASNIPNFATGTSGTPPGAYFTATWGGTNLASALQSTSRYWVWRSNNESYQSSRASIEGSHERRGEDWDLQLRLTTQELVQFDKQITAGQIRVAIAEKELENHEKQIEDSNAVYDFMKNKFTSRDLYGSMVSQISGLYFQSYRLAYETAKRAEKAYRMERCLTISNFIQFGYWDSLRKGLLAGERLELDLKRMELAYLNDNQREYELTKSVSLMQLDPVALMMLKETGRCEIELPEALFDMDYPGHYMRRIKSVSLTLPCVVGPYTNINCTLTHLTSRIRISPTAQRPYVEDTETEDSRFTYQLGSLQSIATSHGRDDSGVFELSFKDERFQQFECLGAVSRWRLELLRETNAFNLNTLSDVIVKLHYTAREGGALLKEKVMETVVKAMPKEGLSRFFSAKHEFPDEWYRFLYVPESGVGHSLGLDLMLERFPFLYQGKEIELNSWEIFVKLKSGMEYQGGDPLFLDLIQEGQSQFKDNELTLDPVLQLPYTKPFGDQNAESIGPWIIRATEVMIPSLHPDLKRKVTVNGQDLFQLNPEAFEDLWVVCHYSVLNPV